MGGETTDVDQPECLVESVDHVRLITLNRPHRANAISLSLRRILVDELGRAGADPEVRAIVLTGAGDRHFCAGADLKDMRARDDAGTTFIPPMSSPERHPVEVMLETYKPVIAALNGATVGGGLELALACDLRIAAEGIHLALPEAKIGMGGVFGSVILPRRVPTAVAFEMMFTGDPLTAEEAARWGLVNRVVPRQRLLAEAMELAGRIAENAPLTIRRMKEMALKGMEMPITSAIRLDVGPNPYFSEDRKEGIRAFLEKRKPQWTGR